VTLFYLKTSEQSIFKCWFSFHFSIWT